MRTRVQVVLAVLLVALSGVIVWQVLRSHEPVYQGKPLSVWLQRYISGGSIIDVRQEQEADEAIRQIGTNAIPTLLHMLRARDSRLKLELLGLAYRQSFIRVRILPAYFTTRQAAAAFHALGASASNAVPILIQTYREEIGPDSQCGCAEALGWIGPAASEAIPDLVSATTNSNIILRWVAVAALGHIHAKPGLVVPVLIKSLRDSNFRVRRHAASSLAAFGSEAIPAIPGLIQSLEDPNATTRTSVSNALKAINPEAAVKAGVK
jgi:hypothetical protein